jgi:hypothetical protein
VLGGLLWGKVIRRAFPRQHEEEGLEATVSIKLGVCNPPISDEYRSFPTFLTYEQVPGSLLRAERTEGVSEVGIITMIHALFLHFDEIFCHASAVCSGREGPKNKKRGLDV